MTKTNYKLIAKKRLANLEKEYEELKIKNNDEYYEDDNYIFDISDLEYLLESNGDYTVRRTYQDCSTVHYIPRNNFKDLNNFDDDIERDLIRIEKQKRIEENKILKTEKLREILRLDESQIKKIKNTFIYNYFTKKEKAEKYYKVIHENRKRFLKHCEYV